MSKKFRTFEAAKNFYDEIVNKEGYSNVKIMKCNVTSEEYIFGVGNNSDVGKVYYEVTWEESDE